MTIAVPDDQPATDHANAGSDQPATGLAKAGSNLVDQLLRVGIDGFGPFKSAERSAEEACKGRTNAQAIKALKRNHCLMAGSQGFVTNIGGFLTMPVALPANIGAAYLIQTHLAASIASVHGHDLDSEEVQSAILLCLLGNAGTEVLKQAGIKVGTKYTVTLIRRIPIAVIREINKRAGFMLLAKFGTKRATITLARGVPLVGGGIGGTVDAVATQAVGTFADKFFSPAS